MSVSISTIRANAYTTLYNHLQTGTYALTTNNIHPSYKDIQLRSEGYPQVIILTPVVRVKKGTMTYAVRDAIINYTIEVYHNSAANVQALADDINNKINTGREVFTQASVTQLNLDSEDYDELYYGPRQTMHKITQNWTCKVMG